MSPRSKAGRNCEMALAAPRSRRSLANNFAHDAQAVFAVGEEDEADFLLGIGEHVALERAVIAPMPE